MIWFYRVTDSNQKENLGILVQYKVKVKLFLGSLGGWVYYYSFVHSLSIINGLMLNACTNIYSELVAELPFTLMHPKPLDEDRPSSSSGSHKSESSITNKENGDGSSSKPSSEQKIVDDLVDTNLIQLDP